MWWDSFGNCFTSWWFWDKKKWDYPGCKVVTVISLSTDFLTFSQGIERDQWHEMGSEVVLLFYLIWIYLILKQTYSVCYFAKGRQYFTFLDFQDLFWPIFKYYKRYSYSKLKLKADNLRSCLLLIVVFHWSYYVAYVPARFLINLVSKKHVEASDVPKYC